MFHLRTLEFQSITESIASLTTTDKGRSLVEALSPTTDVVRIQKSMADIKEMRLILARSGSIPLNSLVAFTSAYEALLKHSVLTPVQLDAIRQFLQDTQKLKRFMVSKTDVAPLVTSYALTLDPLPSLVEAIETAILGHHVIDQASGHLLKTRKKINALEEKIKAKLHGLIQKADADTVLQDHLIAMREGRYVIPIKAHGRSKIEGRVLDASKSGATVFIEPESVRLLHEQVQNLRIIEDAEVFKILSDLTNQVALHAQTLALNSECMVHYDVLFAKAKYCQAIQCESIHVTSNGSVHLIEAKHPLLGPQAVPLHLSIGLEAKGIVITGPNTGGKTVVLKTVGLLTLMAMAGLQVPASPGSHLSVFQHVLADIGDGQSITQNLSTFSSHIQNINTILGYANPHSLVLLDEVGSGTEPNEGAGIAMAILEALYDKSATLLATTHFSQLKAFASDHKGFQNASMLFDAQTLKPLYQLRVGQVGKSHALLIALKLGMDHNILDRAHHLCYDKPFDRQDYKDSISLVSQEVPEVLTAKEATKHQPPVGHWQPKKTKAVQKYHTGDSVTIAFMHATGIILGDPNARGEYPVEIKGKKYTLSHKRMTPFIDKNDLYPDDYDMNILTKSVAYRKTDKKISKGKGKGLVLEHEPAKNP